MVDFSEYDKMIKISEKVSLKPPHIFLSNKFLSNLLNYLRKIAFFSNKVM